jgi:hypothetical protein
LQKKAKIFSPLKQNSHRKLLIQWEFLFCGRAFLLVAARRVKQYKILPTDKSGQRIAVFIRAIRQIRIPSDLMKHGY